MQISFRMHFGSNFSWIHKMWILLILSKPFVCLSFCLFVLSFSPEMLDGYFLILGMNLRNYNEGICCKKTCPRRFYKFFEKLPEGTLWQWRMELWKYEILNSAQIIVSKKICFNVFEQNEPTITFFKFYGKLILRTSLKTFNIKSLELVWAII